MKDSFIDLFLTNFFKITFALVILGLFFYIMLPFMISIVLGGILAMALSPLLDFFIKREFSSRRKIKNFKDSFFCQLFEVQITMRSKGYL